MNELQRQMYLSSLGVDTYMPRWRLAFAPTSVACILPISQNSDNIEQSKLSIVPNVELMFSTSSRLPKPVQATDTFTPINNLITDVLEAKKSLTAESLPNSALEKLIQEDVKTGQKTAPTIMDSFSLSIWRPFETLMIIDSRNTKLALPTELLLKNILCHLFSEKVLDLQEEVLRWPMIENSFAKRTLDEARMELQTWLSVQCEIRPIKYLWLLGANAARCYLPEESDRNNYLWRSIVLADASINALVLPSFNELLQQPTQKKQLYSAILGFHS